MLLTFFKFGSCSLHCTKFLMMAKPIVEMYNNHSSLTNKRECFCMTETKYESFKFPQNQANFKKTKETMSISAKICLISNT